MAKQEEKGSLTPLLVIVGIAILTIGGIYFISQSGDDDANQNTAGGGNNGGSEVVKNYNQAPPGAQPPNVMGGPNAPVVIEEFADFQCPTCARVHPVVKEVTANYGTRIKYIFRNFPLPIHNNAYEAALSAEAAGLQGKFWQMQDQIFKGQPTWSSKQPNARETFKEYATKIGLDVAKFEADVTGLNAKARVDQDMRRANALAVNGTPAFYINGRPIPLGQITKTEFPKVIDAELKKFEKKEDE